MSISFACPDCGKKYKAPESAAGKTSACSGCGGRVTCPSPPDLDPYAGLDPYADLEEDNSRRPAAPTSEEPAVDSAPAVGKVKKKKKSKGKRARLRTVAESQRGILICILLQIGLYITMLMTPPQYRLYVFTAYVLVGLAATILLFKLAIELYNIGMGIVLGVLSLLPCLGLIILLLVSSKATRRLQDNGVQVGLLGADLSQFR